MAKPKKYITSKLKRKFVLGGDTNVYEASVAPTSQMQALEDARKQAEAAQNLQIQRSNLANQFADYQASNIENANRIKEENKVRAEEDKAAQDKAISTVTTGASKIGKDLLKSNLTSTAETATTTTPTVVVGTNMTPTWTAAAPTYTAQSAGYATPTLVDPAMQATTATTGELVPGAATVGANQATNATTTAGTASTVAQGAGQMSNLAAGATSLGLVAAGEGVGYWAKHRQDKIDKGRGYSDYYSDTHYTTREAAGQIGKSTLKGAGYGVTLGHAVPGIGEVVGAAIGAQAGLMVGTGIAAKQYYDTKGVKVFGKQYGAKNKYDENLDPTVIAERERKKQLEAMSNTATAMDNARLSSMTQYDTNTGFNLKSTTGQMAKYGGKLEYLEGGVAKSLGRGAKEYVGRKHEQGGIDLPGNIEVEGGETEQNNYIFSATLKLPTGITYAKAHKNLLKSGASPEEIKQLALSQEAAAGRNPNEIKTMKFAKYGGPLKYDNGGPKSSTNQESNYKQQLAQALTSSGLSAEEFAKQNGIDVGLLNDVISGNKTLTADEAGLLGAAISNKPVNTMGYKVPVDDKGNPKSAPTTNSTTATNAPTINNQLSTFENIAKTAGALDFTSPDAAGGIWAGDKYEKEWKPLVARTMRDDVNADKVIAYLENYNGQDAEDVKAKIAGKSRDEQIKIINRLATDKQVGPFHNAVLEGINSTQDYVPMKPLEPKPFPREEPTLKFNTTKPETPLPNRPEYKDQNIGWIQGLPAVGAMFSNVKPANYTPELAAGYVQPGAVGRAYMGRVSYNTERAANQGNLSAMNTALQNMAGPGAIAGMLAAKTKADQQGLAITNAEQNANIGLAAKEAEMNTGISKFNVGTAMQAQTTNAGLGMQNAAMQNDARKFNAGARMQADMYNLETKLGAGEKAANTIAQYDMDTRQLKATERYAKATDYSGALNREQVYNDLKRASQDPKNKDFYGKSEAELWDYARRYDKQMYGDRGNVIINNGTASKEEQKKFGGAKKYISRLGDLKNVKYKV